MGCILLLLCVLVMTIIIIYVANKNINLESENLELRLKACSILDKASESRKEIYDEMYGWQKETFKLQAENRRLKDKIKRLQKEVTK